MVNSHIRYLAYGGLNNTHISRICLRIAVIPSMGLELQRAQHHNASRSKDINAADSNLSRFGMSWASTRFQSRSGPLAGL